MPGHFEMSYCLRDNTSSDYVSHRAGCRISKWKGTIRKKVKVVHTCWRNWPFLLRRRFGSQFGNTIPGWLQYMQLATEFLAPIRSELSPFATKRGNQEQWNLITMTTASSQREWWAGSVKVDTSKSRGCSAPRGIQVPWLLSVWRLKAAQLAPAQVTMHLQAVISTGNLFLPVAEVSLP